MKRRLTLAQQNRLDRLADDHPEARVVGWRDTKTSSGPVIRYRDTFRFLNHQGRLNAVRAA